MMIANEKPAAVDPVCGMTVNPAKAAGQYEHAGHTYYFCGASCLARFKAEPEKYVSPAPEKAPTSAPAAEGTRHFGVNSLYGRMEAHEVEIVTLALERTADQLRASSIALPPTCPSLVHCVGGRDVARLSTVLAFTLGGVRELLRWRGFEGGIGAGLTFYAVPETLKASHGDHPVSFQVFFRLRPPAGSMGRMWNMRMSQPMKSMSDEDMPHQMNQVSNRREAP